MSQEIEKQKNDENKWPPAWAWIFIIACVAIPIISLGGAIPGAIGVGAAAGCYQISRDASRSTQTRVIISFLITAIAWLLFIGFIILVVPAIVNSLN